MSEQVKSTWCGNYVASTRSRNTGKNTKETSVQKFCCLKCKTQYDDRYGID